MLSQRSTPSTVSTSRSGADTSTSRNADTPATTRNAPDATVATDGFTLHRCTCKYKTILGSHGFDSTERYVYKVIWRDRFVLVYFGVFAVSCRDCKRWCRVRMLPKERRAEITPMSDRRKIV